MTDTYHIAIGDKQLAVTMTSAGNLVINIVDYDGGFDTVRARIVIPKAHVPEFASRLNTWLAVPREPNGDMQ